MKNKEDPDLKKLAPIIFLAFTLTFFSFSDFDKTQLSIHVKENPGNYGIPFSSILVIAQNGDSISTLTDFDGNARLNLPLGLCKLKVSCVGYAPETREVNLSNENVDIEVILSKKAVSLGEVSIIEYVVPLVSSGSPALARTVTFEEIESAPTRDINSMVSHTAGVYSTTEGSSRDIRGSRSDATSYYVDGIKVRGEASGHSEVKYKLKGKPVSKTDKAISFENKLTAGEINDFSKWKLWEQESRSSLENVATNFGIRADERFSFQVSDERGWPVTDAEVHLFKNGNEVSFVHTDNTGKAECWIQSDSNLSEKNILVKVISGKESFSFYAPHSFHKGINSLKIHHECSISNILDLVFIVDATGSMQDEINYLKAEMTSLVNSISGIDKHLEIRVASIFYRDYFCNYLVRYEDFKNAENATRFISEQNADAGGDTPEAMDKGLSTIQNLSWSVNARARIAFLIADAPMHNNDSSRQTLKRSIEQANNLGVRIVPVACSGVDKSTELLMRNIALLTNGTYVYLTDFSSVGDQHIVPTTDKIDHKKLNHILHSILKNFTRTPACPEDDSKEQANEDSKEFLSDSLEQSVKESISDNAKPLDDRLKISPNPATDFVRITSVNEMHELLLFDSNGKVLQKFAIDSKEMTLDLSMFPVGQYILVSNGKKRNSFGKLVITR